jgi:hypothetical protein
MAINTASGTIWSRAGGTWNDLGAVGGAKHVVSDTPPPASDTEAEGTVWMVCNP